MRKPFIVPVLAAALCWAIWLRPPFLAGPANYVIVSGRSMEPLLFTGDLVITQRQAAYAAGDIVAFRVNGQFVIHRIVGGSSVDGFETQGDNKTSIDPWRPAAEDIVGKLWIHLPGAGTLISRIRQPLLFASLATGAAVFAFPPQTRKRRRRKASMGSYLERAISPLGQSASVTALLGVAVVLTLGMGYGAIYSFGQPLDVAQQVEVPQFTHRSSFIYTVHTLPSTLDPDGVLGPISPSLSEDQPEEEPAPVIVFTRLARNLELEFEYALEGPVPAAIQGQFMATLRVDAGEAWSKSFELAPPAPFAGTELSRAVNVDFNEVSALIETVEQETGYQAGSYAVSVIPSVIVQGQMGTEAVNDSYAPVFSMTFSRTQISLDTDLARTEPRTRTETRIRENAIRVLGTDVPVRLARWTSLPGAILGLGTTIMLLVLGVLGYGQAEAVQIEARYGSLILLVKTADMPQEGRSVDVATIRDLARLATQNGRNILYMRTGRASHLYFVREGDTTYRYTINAERTEA